MYTVDFIPCRLTVHILVEKSFLDKNKGRELCRYKEISPHTTNRGHLVWILIRLLSCGWCRQVYMQYPAATFDTDAKMRDHFINMDSPSSVFCDLLGYYRVMIIMIGLWYCPSGHFKYADPFQSNFKTDSRKAGLTPMTHTFKLSLNIRK